MDDYVARISARWIPSILSGDGVAIPDDPEEMNWRCFFAHSQDMQGFAAGIFTGGLNEDRHPNAPSFQGLRDRWPDSRSMIQGLAAVWEDAEAQAELRRWSHPFRPANEKALGIAPIVELLDGPKGNEATRVFVQTLGDLRGNRLAKKTNAMLRAYVQNAHLLQQHHGSFREYLLALAPDIQFPAAELVESERVWRQAIVRDFYNVGATLANYMLCDWLLWLWRAGVLGWFESYKADSVFLRTLADQDKLPEEAATDFVAFSRRQSVHPGWLPEASGLANQPLPPRLLNEAIWLAENRSQPAID